MIENLEINLLNQAEYFYLREISEPRDNSLRLIIEEAIVNRDKKPAAISDELSELRAIRADAFPIESVTGCKSFELVWDRYAAYLVTEELAGTGGNCDSEIYSGRLFRTYIKSNFLDHLARDIGATLEPIQHYKLVCLNHLIDVASTKPPKIRQIHALNPASGRIDNLAR